MEIQNKNWYNLGSLSTIRTSKNPAVGSFTVGINSVNGAIFYYLTPYHIQNKKGMSSMTINRTISNIDIGTSIVSNVTYVSVCIISGGFAFVYTYTYNSSDGSLVSYVSNIQISNLKSSDSINCNYDASMVYYLTLDGSSYPNVAIIYKNTYYVRSYLKTTSSTLLSLSNCYISSTSNCLYMIFKDNGIVYQRFIYTSINSNNVITINTTIDSVIVNNPTYVDSVLLYYNNIFYAYFVTNDSKTSTIYYSSVTYNNLIGNAYTPIVSSYDIQMFPNSLSNIDSYNNKLIIVSNDANTYGYYYIINNPFNFTQIVVYNNNFNDLFSYLTSSTDGTILYVLNNGYGLYYN